MENGNPFDQPAVGILDTAFHFPSKCLVERSIGATVPRELLKSKYICNPHGGRFHEIL